MYLGRADFQLEKALRQKNVYSSRWKVASEVRPEENEQGTKAGSPTVRTVTSRKGSILWENSIVGGRGSLEGLLDSTEGSSEAQGLEGKA